MTHDSMYSRRSFGKIALSGLSVAAAWGAKIDSTVKGVRLGTITYSFRDLPRTPGTDNNVDAVIQALTDCGIGEIELFSPNIEPTPAERGGGRGPATPEQQAARSQAREDLRKWRLTTPIGHFQEIRKKFDAAGISLYAYTMNYSQDFTDEEIDKTFEQAKGLGVRIIASSTQVTMTKRLLPIAEKHKIAVAFHGHSNITDANEFATPESFQKALDMSKYFKINLDIGHFTAGGFDAVDYIRQHHDRISHLHVKDRKKNDGPNVPWGQGDTPIKAVLAMLRDQKYPIPAFVEYEYRGSGTSVEETKKCLAYMKEALA